MVHDKKVSIIQYVLTQYLQHNNVPGSELFMMVVPPKKHINPNNWMHGPRLYGK